MNKMNRRGFLKQLSLGVASLALPRMLFANDGKRPNVLFLCVDDMNDWIGCLAGYPDVETPNIDRFSQRGLLFTNSHCVSPVCNPSRTAIMTGLLPSTTGIYNNGQWWKPVLGNVKTIPEYFRSQGYWAEGGGKIFHHTTGFNPPTVWDDYFDRIEDDPGKSFPVNGWKREKWMRPSFDWGVLKQEESEYGDYKVADWAAEFLSKPHDKPFFLGVGIFHPHMAWYAPQAYFDRYPQDNIHLPLVLDNDLDDIPKVGLEIAAYRQKDWQRIRETGRWKEAVRAYMASISFADAQVGRVLDALDASPYADNTIIVFWSDHGWHLGEKQHWHKSTLWERATRSPFIIVAPGITKPGAQCSRPVGLIDIYPTLIELCGLPTSPKLDGQSLVPLLKDPKRNWQRPVLTTFGRGNHALRSERWRYIRYKDGWEELYDHQSDQNEWNNLAEKPEYEAIKKEFARWLPEHDEPDAPKKNEYIFDEETYTWTPR